MVLNNVESYQGFQIKKIKNQSENWLNINALKYNIKSYYVKIKHKVMFLGQFMTIKKNGIFCSIF